MKNLIFFLMTICFSSALLQAGHVPPPPPSLPLPDDLNPIVKGPEGILPVYPVSAGENKAFEFVIDTTKQKYEMGEETFAWPWENKNEETFLLPKINFKLGQKAISLNKKFFKNFSSIDARKLQELGNFTLPLLIAPLQFPSFPEGYSAFDELELKEKQAQIKSSKKIRSQALKVLKSLKGEVVEPYLYLALVDLDSEIANQAFKFFEKNPPKPGPLLLLTAHHNSKRLLDLTKTSLGDVESKDDILRKIKAIQKVKKQEDLVKIIKDKRLAPEALLVALEKLDIPSFKGDEGKKQRKKIETFLKSVEKAIKVQFTRFKEEPPKYNEISILLGSIQEKIKPTDTLESLTNFSRNPNWWIRLLTARALKDYWRQRSKATPILLERQRDWFFEVRQVANESLRWIHSVPIEMGKLPDLASDSFTVDLWEKWWLERQSIAGLDEEKGWTTIPMKRDEGQVYSPTGPVKHAYLTGKFKKTKLSLIDHNDNDKFDDYGLDNFVIGDLSKPGTFLSHLAKINKKFYYIRLKPNEYALQIKPYKGPLGTLSVKELYSNDVELGFLVIGKSPDVTLQIDRDKKGKILSQEIPAGYYHVYAGNVQHKKKSANNGYIAHIGTGHNKIFEVPQKEAVEITVGEDLKIDVKIDIKNEGTNHILEIKNPQIYGHYDELYFAIEPDIENLQIRFLDTANKLIKSIDWKPEIKSSNEKRTAELLRFRSELKRSISGFKEEISELEKQNAREDDPTSSEYVEALAFIALYKTRISQYEIRLIEISTELSDLTIKQFNTIEVPVETFPEEFFVEATGNVFFGTVKPFKIHIKDNQRNKN